MRADGGRGRARPIAELVAQFESGERPTPNGREWAALSPTEQHAILGGYRLAYTSEAPVNWCPGLGTVLSNEEVTNEGRSERGNYPVFKRSLRQWMMRITAYADRLADDLDRVDWPEKVKLMQRNWIGRSQGARVSFPVVGQDASIEVFTTRPDTLFGATFMVLAPEHPLLESIVSQGDWSTSTKESWKGGAATPKEAVAAYRLQASRKSEVERQTEGKDKTGVFTGAFATNPVNGEQIPVFVADYVLMGYGTGAIMAVPGQDKRDWEFAARFELPIVRTVQPAAGHPEDEAYVGEGPAINSANDEVSLDGMGVAEAKAAIIEWLEAKGLGEGTVNYRLRDWLFSRQRYWGEPFPIVFDEEGNSHALPESMLPVTLPDVPDYSPQDVRARDADSPPRSRRCRGCPSGSRSSWTWVTAAGCRSTAARPTRCPTGPDPAGTTCATSTRPTTRRSATPRTRRTGWARTPRRSPGRPRASATRAASTSTSAASSMPCCTCSTRASGTRCCSTCGHLSSEEPFRKYFTRATSRRTRTPTRAASTCRPRRSRRRRRCTAASRSTRGRANRSTVSTARSASR